MFVYLAVTDTRVTGDAAPVTAQIRLNIDGGITKYTDQVSGINVTRPILLTLRLDLLVSW